MSTGVLPPRHAFYCGWILDLARKYGMDFVPILDDAGNYTDRIALELSPSVSITLTIPPPPPDWRLP